MGIYIKNSATFRTRVLIDSSKAIHKWSLSDVGKSRVAWLANSGALNGSSIVICSAENQGDRNSHPFGPSDWM